MRRTLGWWIAGLVLLIAGCHRSKVAETVRSEPGELPPAQEAPGAVVPLPPGAPPPALPAPPPVRLTHLLAEPATLRGYDGALRQEFSLTLPARTKVALGSSDGETSYVTTEHGHVGHLPTSKLRQVWRVDLPPDAMAVAQGSNLLGCDLYRELRGSDGNLFFSPLSIHTALAMTWAGATGQNEADMAQALHFTIPQARVHAAVERLHKSLTHSEQTSGFSLSVANRLWGQQGHPFVPQFLSITRQHYGAELSPVDFARPEDAAATINAWVQEQTRGKIRDLVSPSAIDPRNTVLVLTNAVYFKADWTEPFLETATRPGKFHLQSAETVEFPLMRKVRTFRWRQGDGFQMLEMPYGQHQLAMLILLPDAIDGLAALEAELTEANLRRWQGELRSELVDLTLPRFKLESKFSLQETLRKLGMARAFEPQDDNFAGITPVAPQWLTAVLHKAYVDVNEKGTEAAAATGVALAGAAPPAPPPKFIADHPFVFLIRDNQSGAILFLGRVVDPRG